VESSWRTRKHLKGDYLNLHDLGAALGVIVLLGDGDDVDATRRFAQTMVDRPGPRVLVWSEQNVQQLLTSTITGGSPAATVTDPSEPVPADADEQAHAGKYRALWAWLRTSLGAPPGAIRRDRGGDRHAPAAVVPQASGALVVV
jgi:hypothetical protein